MKKVCTIIPAAAVLLTLFFPACTSSDGVQVGKPAPDFTLEGLKGSEVRLGQLRGKVVALVFWASWCPHCKKEIPELNRLEKDLKGKGLEVLAVSFKESPEKLKPFAEKNGITYRVLLDRDGAVSSAYGIVGLPSLVIVDRDGTVRFSGIGLPEKARQIIGELVGQGPEDSHN
jgi:peroxiredoxin